MNLYTYFICFICTSLHAQEGMSYLKTIENDLSQNGIMDHAYLTYDIGSEGSNLEIEIDFYDETGLSKSISTSKIFFPLQAEDKDNFQVFNFSYSEKSLALIYTFKSITHYLFFSYAEDDFDLIFYSELHRNQEPQTSKTLYLRDGILYTKKSSQGETISEQSRKYYVQEIPTLSNFSGFSLKKTL